MSRLIKKESGIYLFEAGGSSAGKLRIADISVKEAKEYAQKVCSENDVDFEKEYPKFDKNFKLLQKKLRRGWTKRREMPVIEPGDIPKLQKRLVNGLLDVRKPFVKGQEEFPEFLKGKIAKEFLRKGRKDGVIDDDKVKVKRKDVSVGDLKPIQQEVYMEKSFLNLAKFGKEKTKKFLKKGNTICSNDMYIIDGHHRLAQAMFISPNFNYSCIVIDLPIDKLLKVSRSYGDAIGNKRNQ